MSHSQRGDGTRRARISSGDRVVVRIQDDTIYFLDVVKHDDIGRDGRRPRR